MEEPVETDDKLKFTVDEDDPLAPAVIRYWANLHQGGRDRPTPEAAQAFDLAADMESHQLSNAA